MAYLIALAVLALTGIVASVWLIRTDGYRRVPTDPRRLPGGTDLTAPTDDAAPAISPAEATARVAPLSSLRRTQRGAARA
ncbi:MULTISPECIES: hypothetical protein [Microbacterium]|jgi:hypothetical protein|uniref:hypothetical protein n=1 Tax=Microbacterium TaxID=33882 RepID=UPI001D17B197|nr:hypothetical protein [Microbacterium testaceum]MCC4247705.1 hypothetical protein [Microbacterium testaceum]